VKAAVETCHRAGVRVVMITGDQPATAAAIGANLGIKQEGTETRLCSDLHDPQTDNLLSEEEIDRMTSNTNVWARAHPQDKVAIVESLQRQGHTPAMTGDGVNDAPALKLADIGTAMGLAGSEVAKGSADIVLMDDDFTTIVAAVEEGRRAYNCIQVYVTFYLSLTLAEIIAYAVPLFSGGILPNILADMQMLALNVFSHALPPLFLMYNPTDPDNMMVPPRRKDAKLLHPLHLKWMVLPWSLCLSTLWILSALCFCWMHTGTFWVKHILGSDDYMAVESGGFVCEYAGVYRTVLENIYDKDGNQVYENAAAQGGQQPSNPGDALAAMNNANPVSQGTAEVVGGVANLALGAFTYDTGCPAADKTPKRQPKVVDGVPVKVFQPDTLPFHCKCLTREWPWTTDATVKEEWGQPLTNLLSSEQVNEAHNEEGGPMVSGGCGPRCSPDGQTGLTDPGLGVWEKCLEVLRTRETLKKINKKPNGLMDKVNTEEHDPGTKTKAKLERCEVPGGDQQFAQKWCWKEGDSTSEHISPLDRNLLDKATNCGALGMRSATTMSFVAGILANLLLVVSFSSRQNLFIAGSKNLHLCGVCVLCFAGALTMVYVSHLVPQLESAPLDGPHLVTGILFALAAIIILELCKVGYRFAFDEYQDLRKYHAKATASGQLSPWATDMEIRDFRAMHGPIRD
jgi:hypothetical protein